MSDHEGHGYDDWEAVSLPGGPASSYGAHESFNQRIVPNHFSRRDGPAITNGFSNSKRFPDQPPPNKLNHVPSSYRPEIQSVYETGQSHVSMPVQPLSARRPVTRSETEGMKQSRNGEPPAGAFELMHTWDALVNKSAVQDESARKVARDNLDDICQKTSTWIPTPDGNSNKLQIWGTPEGMTQAKANLKLWESEIRLYGLKSKGKAWAKMHAVNFMEEGRAERRTERQQAIDDWNKLGPELSFAFEAFLIWPKTLILSEFKEEYDKVLESMRSKYVCRIEVEDDGYPRIRVCATSEKEVLEIYHRLVNLVKDQVAQRAGRLRANLVRMPSASMYRDRVGLDKDPQTNSFLPTMHGKPFDEEGEDNWNALRQANHTKDRTKIKLLIKRCLRSLHIYGKHVRMRVIFGELGFHQYRRPSEGQDTHQFDDFYRMVYNPRTEMVQQPLRSTEGDISGLVDALAAMEAFGKPVESYLVQYDFEGDTHSTLRLEVEFKMGLYDELETCGQRWLEYKTHEVDEKLEINVLDFERPNYAIRVGAVDIFANARNRHILQKFQANLGFDHPKDGIKAHPRRRAVYPPGQSKLRSVSEISLARFGFKNTQGTFEIRRKDVYEEGVGRSSATPMSSTWTAAYYYEDWDNYLGEFANLQPGHDVSWEREIATFFPESMSEFDPRALPRGWQAFFEEVEQIQDLLGTAMANLSKVDEGRDLSATTTEIKDGQVNGKH